MPRTFFTFWLPAFLSALLVGALMRFEILKNISFIDQLLVKPGPPGLIAIIVLVVALWSFIALLFRRILSAREMSVIRYAKLIISDLSSDRDLLSDDFLKKKIGGRYNRSMLRRRLLFVSDQSDDLVRSDRAASLMAGQSSVDVAHTQSAFGPLRALIWALPSLGFMGTAFEMAEAVGGLGSSLSATQGYNDLRNVLVAGVVPHLAGAFNITLFALSSSVVCFLVLSLVYAHEETVLNEADTASLQILAKIKDSPVIEPRDIVAPLAHKLHFLIEQCEQLNANMMQLQQASGYAPIASLVKDVGQKVSQINTSVESLRAGLDHELVITRRPNSR